VIFVHGCFWHQHPSPACADSRIPQSRHDYWVPKLERNVARDAENLRALEESGWKHLVLWECDVERRTEQVEAQVIDFLTE
jgi:DNA mismatch endonuclease (patch repair protein)